MQINLKSTWSTTWYQMDHVSWSLGFFSKEDLLEVGLTRNHETMPLQNLTTIDSLYLIMFEDSTKIEIH